MVSSLVEPIAGIIASIIASAINVFKPLYFIMAASFVETELPNLEVFSQPAG
jgi:hypothetical protein